MIRVIIQGGLGNQMSMSILYDRTGDFIASYRDVLLKFM